MYVDPAGGGQNGDETAYAITKFLAGKIFLADSGKVKGGLEEESLEQLTAVAVRHKPNFISIEKNFGNGALGQIWKPLLLKQHRCAIEDVWESGQKELRIIDILEPIIGSGRLIVDADLLKSDWASCAEYPVEKRASYSLWHQLARITRDKNSLRHDDRLDALAGSCRHWVEALSKDSNKEAAKARRRKHEERMRDPLGNGQPLPAATLAMLGIKPQRSAISRMRRKF